MSGVGAEGGGRGPGPALVGLRGTGKSTAGRLVAEALGRPFVDADLELEARAGRTVAALFAEGGEAAFREREEAVLADLAASHPDAVLATGGGVVLRAANRRRLRAFGFVAWLRADPAVLAARLAADPRGLAGRPALTASGTLGELAELLRVREPLYREVADAVIETDEKTAFEVAEAIARAWAAQWG